MIKRLLFPSFILLSSFFIAFPQDVDKAFEYFNSSQYEKAAIEFEKALPEIEKIFGSNDTSFFSLILINTAISFDKSQQFNKAEKYYIKAKTIYETLNAVNCESYVSVIFCLAILYQEMGNYDQAEPLSLQAVQITKKVLGKEHPGYANSLNNLSTLYYSMGKYDRAESVNLEALHIIKKVFGEENHSYANSLNNLAELYRLMGKYEEAETLYIQSLQIEKKIIGEQNSDYALYLRNLAVFYEDLGNYENAEALYIQAMQIIKKIKGEQHLDYAISLNNLAGLYRKKGDYQKSEPLYLQALQIIKKVGGEEHPDYAIYLSNLAALYNNMENYKKSEPILLQVLQIREKLLGKEHPDYATSLNNLAYIYTSKGNYSEAETLYLQALNIKKQTLGEEHPDYATSLNNLVELYKSMGNYEKAEPFIMKAIIVIFRQLDQQLGFLTEKEMSYYVNTIIIDFIFYQNYFLQRKSYNPAITGESYDIELASKGILLNSTLQIRQSIINSRDTSIVGVYDLWVAIRKSLANQYTLPISKRSLDIEELEEESNELEKKLVRSSQIFAQEHQLLKSNWKNVRENLSDKEVAIEFSSFNFCDGKRWTDSTYYVALVLRKNDEYPQMIYLCEEKQLDSVLNKVTGSDAQKTEQLYSARGVGINGTTQSLHLASKLYDLIWRPIDSLLRGFNTVYYSPSGLLHKISFAAMAAPDSMCLLDKYKLVQLGSTAEIVGSEKVDRYITVSDTAFLCGGINYDQMKTDKGIEEEKELFVYNRGPQISNDSTRSISWRYLPGTYKEAKYIDSLFRKNKISTALYSESNATETLFKNLSGKAPQVIHVSTHGFFFPEPKKEIPKDAFIKMGEETYRFSENPLLRSGLILAGANYVWKGGEQTPGQDDGILTAYEVSNMNLYNTKLVVLSACETGLGDIKGSEGVFGLQRAFKMAGVDYIIMSLWKVPDKETTEFMKLFYSNCLSNHSIRESFYLTQTTMRKKYDPYYWAAFVLME